MSAASSSGGGWSPNDRRQAAWNIVDIIKDVHRGVDVTGGLPPQDVLPGFGSKRMSCGSPRTSFCGDHGHTHETRTTCDKSTCPHCAPNWARRRATYVCRKLAALRAMLDSPWNDHQKLHHLSVSPQKRGETFRFEGDDEDEIRDALFQAAYDIMDELDLEGFVVYHPFVGKDGDDRGFWKGFLGDWSDWLVAREELMFHPHVHVIGVSDFVPGEGVTDVVQEETGWVINRITRGGDDSDDNVSLGNNLDLARAVTYTLSHCGIYETGEGRHRYAGRWHGEHVQDATPPEKYEMEWERIVRTVAPKTLGLKKRDLLCSSDAVATTQTSIGTFDAAQARMRDEAVGSSGSDGGGDGGDPPAPVDEGATMLPDTPDVLVEVDLPEVPCEAPLFDIRRAREFLEDDEWVEQASHADELREKYREYQVTQDFLHNADRDLGLVQSGRGDEARIDWPPPD